jgi:hypothetical protein
MLFRRETPSSVMFDDLRRFGGISNIEAARMLLSAKVMYGGSSPRDKAEDRTYLSRYVVHMTPDDADASQFADFEVSTFNVSSRLLAKHGHNRKAIAEHYLGDASTKMCTALDGWGRDSKFYSNELRRLSEASFKREEYRCTLLLMLFLATGCLADAREGVAIVEDYARHRLSEDIETLADDYAGVDLAFSGLLVMWHIPQFCLSTHVAPWWVRWLMDPAQSETLETTSLGSICASGEVRIFGSAKACIRQTAQP